MIRRPPRSTRMTHSFPTRRSSDLNEAGECEVYWNLTRVNSEELLNMAVDKLETEIERLGGVENLTEETMPEAHIRGDVNTPYRCIGGAIRSEEHTSELQSLMRISYAVFRLKKKTTNRTHKR